MKNKSKAKGIGGKSNPNPASVFEHMKKQYGGSVSKDIKGMINNKFEMPNR